MLRCQKGECAEQNLNMGGDMPGRGDALPSPLLGDPGGDEEESGSVERRGEEDEEEEEEEEEDEAKRREEGLKEELERARGEIRIRDRELSRLSRIRQDVESELQDLTASLFQEAHRMVREAGEREARAERRLEERKLELDVLSAELAALKHLLLPNSSQGIFKKHRRSPSHFNLNYGRESSPPESPSREVIQTNEFSLEVDPEVHQEFLAWRQSPTMEKDVLFIARLYREDIDHCLEFSNKDLTEQVKSAVETGDIFIEVVIDKADSNFPKKCALLETVRQCHYRLRFGDGNIWYSISRLCRNRIIAVCDLLNYLRYVERGLVKSSVHDVYWEIVRLRKEIVLARLGLALAS